MSAPLRSQHRAEGLADCQRVLRSALETVGTIKGRAEIDNRGVGAAKFLVERTIQSIERVREKLLDDSEPVFEETASR